MLLILTVLYVYKNTFVGKGFIWNYFVNSLNIDFQYIIMYNNSSVVCENIYAFNFVT